MTRIPYEKGALFLTTLEHAFGRERFDAFLRDYFDHFAFQSITTADFERLPSRHAPQDRPRRGREDRRPRLAPRAGPAGGLPRAEIVAVRTRCGRGPRLARRQDSRGSADHSRTGRPTNGSTSSEPSPLELPPERMAALDAAFSLTASGNSEIASNGSSWPFGTAIAPADARLEAFLTSIGRRKFLMPLYGELKKTPEGTARAQAIYAKAQTLLSPDRRRVGRPTPGHALA